MRVKLSFIILVSTGVLNIMKDSLTLITLICLMFYQNWKLAIFSLIMMPLAAIVAKSLGKRMGKATTKSVISSGNFTTLISEILKSSKIIKIYQREKFEKERSSHSKYYSAQSVHPPATHIHPWGVLAALPAPSYQLTHTHLPLLSSMSEGGGWLCNVRILW